MKKAFLLITGLVVLFYGIAILQTQAASSSITLTSPNGGEIWQERGTYTIIWSYTGSFNSVGLTLLQNGRPVLGIGTVPNTGSHLWQIPYGYIGSGYTIRAVNMSDTSVYDDSGNFSIYNPSDATPPSAPSSVAVSRNSSSDPLYRLKFDYTLPSDSDYYCINIYRSTVSGQLGGLVLNCVSKGYNPGAITGYYPYDDSYIQSTTSGIVYYTVRAVDIKGNISTNTNQIFYGWNSAPADGSIMVTSPSGGHAYKVGDTVLIQWTMSGIVGPAGRVVIWLYKGSQPIAAPKAADVATPNQWNWVISESLGVTQSGSDYKIRVASADYSTIYGETGNFTISPAKSSITVLSPNGGERWAIGSTHTIQWSTSNLSADAQVNIYLYNDDSVLPEIPMVIGLMEKNDGAMDWKVSSNTLKTGSRYRIRIQTLDQTIGDYSDSLFSIYYSSDTTPPSAPTNITVDKNSSSDPSYKLQFSYTLPLDSDYRCINVYRNTELLGGILSDRVVSCANKDMKPGASTGYFPYEDSYIKSKTSGTVSFTVKAVDLANNESTNTDKYSYSWNDSPSITVLSPNGGESLNWSSSNNITWNYSGLSSVSIALYKNSSFFKWIADNVSIPSTNNAAASYDWTPSNTISQANIGNNIFKIRVGGYKGGGWIEDYSDSPFSIVAAGGIVTSDSDNSPDYNKTVLSLITPEKYPDFFTAGVGTGIYLGSSPTYHQIYGLEPNPLTPKPTDKPYSTFYDHCANSSQLNEAFITADGKLGALGVSPPAGYTCSKGAFVSTSSITVLSPNGGEKIVGTNMYDIKWLGSDDLPATQCISTTISLQKAEGSVRREILRILDKAPIGCRGARSYLWRVPQGYEGSQYRVLVQLNQLFPAPGGGWMYPKDESDTNFSITESRGLLNISTGPHNPQAGLIDKGSANNPLLETEFSAVTDEDLLISQLVFRAVKEGVYGVTPRDLINARLYNNSTQIGVAVGQPDENGDFIFPNLSLRVPQNSSTTVMLKADIPFNTEMRILSAGLQTNRIIVSGIVSGRQPQVSGSAFSNFFTIAGPTNPPVPVLLLRPKEEDRVFRIINGKRIWVPNPSVFQAQELKWQEVKEVKKSDADAYKEIKLFRASNDPKVYIFTDQGLKKWIQTPEIFNSYGYNWQDVVEIDSKIVNSIEEAKLIRVTYDPKIYKIENNVKRWIKNPSVFERLQLKWGDVVLINSVELNAHPEEAPIE